jgi:hypothetical protein
MDFGHNLISDHPVTIRRKALIAAIAAAILIAAFLIYAITVLRTCSQAHDIAKGSYEYRLCSFDDEFITKLPIAQPTNTPLYSWRDADGTKPSRRSLKYQSSQPTTQIQQSLNAFLQSNSFHFIRNENECEWWGDQQSELCVTIANDPSRKVANVEVFHVIP